MADSIYKTFTDQTFDLYRSFVSSGFTAEQSFDLTNSYFSLATVNYQVELQRKRTRRDNIQKVMQRYKSDGDSSCQV